MSGRNLEPYIQLVLMFEDGTEETITQWTPEEAYHHATAVLGAVEAANTDAFLVAFMTQEGLQLDNIGPVLLEFRKWRERRRPPEKVV